MKLSIEFDTDNAAFSDHNDEISKILREIGEAIERYGITDGRGVLIKLSEDCEHVICVWWSM